MLNNDFALLDKIRKRYQAYLGESGVEALDGFLTGYAVANENYKRDEFHEFCKYLKRRHKCTDPRKSWVEIIQKQSWETEYEIPLFFYYLDEYRKVGKVLYSVKLSYEQKSYTFYERHQKIENPEYPTKALPAPDVLKLIEIKGIGILLFYYDNDGNKYYEQCFKKLELVMQFCKKCINIDNANWVQGS